MSQGKIFISYAREDFVRVDWLAGILRSNGIEVFIDRNDISVGKDFNIEAQKAISNGMRFISVFSRARAGKVKGYVNE